MRYLGVDYGKKRIGLATSDENGRIAFPFLVSTSESEALENIKKAIKEKKVEAIVFGLSINNSGRENPGMEKARVFAKSVEQETGLPIHFEQEQFSTMEATRFVDNDMRDASASAIILQRFLDKQNNK